VKDASQYYFSIIRFAMNGPGKNLPLFIPLIQTNGFSIPVQQFPDLTIYYVSIGYQRTWNYTDLSGATKTKTFTITPYSAPIRFIPETQDPSVAPVPQVPPTGIVKQDLSTRYYWVYTYKHWTTLVNNALLDAMTFVFDEFVIQWNNYTDTTQPFPYADLNAFLLDHDVPFVKYNEDTTLFEIYGDTRAFNVSGQITGDLDVFGNKQGIQPPIPLFTPPAYVAGDPPSPASTAYLRLFFNDNLFGLMTNFNNTYLGATGNSSIYWPLTTNPVKIGSGTNPVTLSQYIYTNEILFTNQNYTNIQNNNPFLQGLNAVPPPNYNLFFLIPPEKQSLYWISKQDYPSTGSLWSPIASLVFTSTLMPLKKENTAKPILLNQNNTANTNSPSAFEPIITDFVIDQQIERAEGWRDFTLYEPSAEYRMVSMTASHEEIRNIDIQVYWKYRLTGELIPLTMFNCSDVTIKMMFRKIDYRS